MPAPIVPVTSADTPFANHGLFAEAAWLFARTVQSETLTAALPTPPIGAAPCRPQLAASSIARCAKTGLTREVKGRTRLENHPTC